MYRARQLGESIAFRSILLDLTCLLSPSLKGSYSFLALGQTLLAVQVAHVPAAQPVSAAVHFLALGQVSHFEALVALQPSPVAQPFFASGQASLSGQVAHLPAAQPLSAAVHFSALGQVSHFEALVALQPSPAAQHFP